MISKLQKMSLGIHLGLIALVVVAMVEASSSCNDDCISKRFEELEQRLSGHEAEVHSLRRTVADQQLMIQTQNRQIQEIRKELRIERHWRTKQTSLLKTITKESRRIQQVCLSKSFPKNVEEQGAVKETGRSGGIRRSDPAVRSFPKRQERSGIAFSVFLDHSIDVWISHTIKFNRILSNEGNGYNIHTGVFTCPEAGMYLFIFAIGEGGETGPLGVAARLVVNSVNRVDAVVDSFHATQHLQGGNAAILRLNAGDVAWIDSYSGHIDGHDDRYRYTTFSGVLLYA